jgi:glyoxylase-like metal-dependent hydrolase (beta-lactamase superfamily II)
MSEIAPGVHLLTGFPKYAINWYLVGDVLVDAGGRPDTGRIIKQLRSHEVTAHALTHAHPDHQGASHAVCTKLDIPYWVHRDDVEVAEDPSLMLKRQPPKPLNRVMYKMFAGPAHPVDRALEEGDEIAGFQVLHTPGHAKGHVSLWRESDRVLIAGDVLNTAHPFLMKRGLREPLEVFTPDVPENRRSIKRLAALEPELLLVGHGPPLRDTQQLKDLAARLP